MRALRSMAVAAVAATALTIGVGAAAYADPPSGTIPATSDIVAVGSDTIQAVADGFSTDWNSNQAPTHTVPPNVYSWDAVNPVTHQPGDTINSKGTASTQPNCTMTRPNGSGGGISQVELKIKTSDGHYCVDLARASRVLKAGDGSDLMSVLLATDLITVAETSNSNGVGATFGTSTNANGQTILKAIYECNASEISSSFPNAPVTWAEIGGTGTNKNDAIVPVLPQANSGTRQTFLSDISVTTPGSCVKNGSFNGTTIEENEGTNAVFTSSADTLFPYSGGVYVCQVFTLACSDQHGTEVLQNINGKAPLTSSHTINVSGLSAFPSAFQRGLYFVFLNGFTASPQTCTDTSTSFPHSCVPDYLKPLIGGTAPWVCGTTAASDDAKFGFVKSGNCGTLTSNTP